MRLVARSSAVTVKLSSRIRCTRVFKGWYVRIKGILLIFPPFSFWKGRRFETGVSFSRGDITSAIGSLRRIRPPISQSTAELDYNPLIQLHFDYCSLVWEGSVSDQQSDKLKKLHNCAARETLKANYGTSSALLLDILKWDKLVIRRKKHKALLTFKSLNKQAPVYLQNLFYERSTDYDLRNFSHKLTLPGRVLFETKFSFSTRGALLWNCPPENVRSIKTVRKFKEQISHLFESSDSHLAVL